LQEAIEKDRPLCGPFFFPHPAPAQPKGRTRRRILPVFMPQAGCPKRCIFCTPDARAGRPQDHLPAALESMRADLDAARGGPALEVAFYGGTFTALPPVWRTRFLEEAARRKTSGEVAAIRCSTRPDACPPALMRELADQGLDMVELGVQTFDDAVLAAAGRGCAAQDVEDASRAVRDAGLGLGLQLLPGLPGHAPEMLDEDVRRSIRIAPDLVRLHPCLVLDGTPLAELWRSGGYLPWELDETVKTLGRAVLSLWQAAIPVTRIGLAPDPALEAAMLAGPRHPALGTMVRARALFLDIRERLGSRRAAALRAPQRLSGEFWGVRRGLAPDYQTLGLDAASVRFEDREDFQLDVLI